MFFLKLNLHDEYQLYATLLFLILTIHRKCLPFQFLSRGVLTGVQNGALLVEKSVYFAKKMFFLKLKFQDEDQLYANPLFCILIIQRRCLAFQRLSHSIVCTFPT